jgi:hypothetical protein
MTINLMYIFHKESAEDQLADNHFLGDLLQSNNYGIFEFYGKPRFQKT